MNVEARTTETTDAAEVHASRLLRNAQVAAAIAARQAT